MTTLPLSGDPHPGDQAQCFRLVVLSVALVLILGACASAAVRPGTGYVTFRLSWTGLADLDLYVRSPLGETVDFHCRNVESGGTLDIDCNVGEFLCPSPMENVFWPRDSAPPGIYTYWVVVANADGLQASDTYHLRVLFRGGIVAESRSTIMDLQERPLSARIQVD